MADTEKVGVHLNTEAWLAVVKAIDAALTASQKKATENTKSETLTPLDFEKMFDFVKKYVEGAEKDGVQCVGIAVSNTEETSEVDDESCHRLESVEDRVSELEKNYHRLVNHLFWQEKS